MSPDDQAFVDAILADPDDDLPRLVYADWLEERGDPYGEFIRLQVDRARLKTDETVPDWVARQRRERQLLVENDFFLPAEWVDAGLLGLGPDRRRTVIAAFERGWLAGVSVDERTFFQHDELFDRTWPAECRLCVARTLELPINLLFRCVALRRVTWLRLQAPVRSVSRQVVGELTGCAHLSALRTLDLVNAAIELRQARQLVHSPHLTALLELRVSRWSATEPARKYLARHLGERLKVV